MSAKLTTWSSADAFEIVAFLLDIIFEEIIGIRDLRSP